MIEVRNVSYTYEDGTTALQDVSVSFPPEHIFTVLGESGSGKTTLLNCVARFLEPQQGKILLDGKEIGQYEERQFRRAVGVVFQNLYLFPHLTILENMTLAPRRVLGRSERQSTSEAREMLARLGIEELAESYPAQISGGQAQRAAIARGLMLQPEFMLLDEPTSALDANTTDEFARWLWELHENTNFIIVTHDVLFARQASTRGIYLRQGRVQARGGIDEIITEATSGAEA